MHKHSIAEYIKSIKIIEKSMDAKKENQKQKLIRAILYRDARILAESAIELSPDERERFYRMTVMGAIKKADFSKVIEGIKRPEVDQIFSKIKESKYKRRILAYMAGVGFDNYENIREEDVKRFLERYPNPSSFESAENDFLEAVRRSNSKQKYNEYAREMEEFVADAYGKKQEYSQLIQELIHDAEEWEIDKNAVKLEADFLNVAGIEGDEWEQNGQKYQLTPELLKKVGLAPRFLIEIGGVEIAFSDVFMVDVHEAAIAYVKFNGEVKIRGYYRSNSQGMWRYLADYVGGNGEIVWYGVGFNEESLTLPLKIQKTLNQIAMRGMHEIMGINTGFFLGGTARRFESKEDYKAKVAENMMDGAYYREVNREPKLDFGVLSTLKHPPESIDIEGEAAPNYRKQLDHYQMQTMMYGNVIVRQFPSVDDELRYTICETGEGDSKKAWVAGIEVNATITSTGLKSQWVSTGDICTPLYEYKTMTGGYGEPIASGNGANGNGANGNDANGNDANGDSLQAEGYESMWNRYLKLMPIIRKYLYTWRNN